MRQAVQAGRLAHRAGRIPRRLYAAASTTFEGLPDLDGTAPPAAPMNSASSPAATGARTAPKPTPPPRASR